MGLYPLAPPARQFHVEPPLICVEFLLTLAMTEAIGKSLIKIYVPGRKLVALILATLEMKLLD